MRKNNFIIRNIFFGAILLLVCCNSSQNEKVWLKANKYYNNKDFNNCSVELTSIVNNENAGIYIPKALFLLSEIYLNQYQEYYIAIDYLDQILNNYPNDELAKRALFTKAYIYANYLDQYSDAIDLYSNFLSKYPNDELISSVKYELTELDKYTLIIDQILNSK